MPPIDQLQRLPQYHLDALSRQGIFTTGLLLEVSETPTRRQYLADQINATTNDVNEWRDEALLLNLANFGPDQQVLFAQAGIVGLSRPDGAVARRVPAGHIQGCPAHAHSPARGSDRRRLVGAGPHAR